MRDRCFAEGLVSTENAVYEAATGTKMLGIGGTISPDGRTLFRTGNDGVMRVHDLATGFAVQAMNLCSPGKNPPHWTLSPDGKYVAAVPDFGRIGIVDVAHNKEITVIKSLPHGIWVSCLRFAPQDDLLAAGYSDGRVRLWNWRTGELSSDLGKHVAIGDRGVNTVAFSADGQFLATGGGRSDRTIRIWRSRDWALLHVLTGHWSGIQSLAFSREGYRLVSGGEDGTLRLWDPLRGQEILQIEVHQGWVDHIGFTADDRAVLSSNFGGAVSRLWGGLSARVPPTRSIDLLPWLRRFVDEKPTAAGSAGGHV